MASDTFNSNVYWPDTEGVKVDIDAPITTDSLMPDNYKVLMRYNQVCLECWCEGVKAPSFKSFLKGA